MFEQITQKRIFVTGPQRSGTRICAKMVALDTGLRYIDECDFRIDKVELLPEGDGVVHCPALLHEIPNLANDESLVIVMIRDTADIIASQKRINWGCEKDELKKYGTAGKISEVKYAFWNSIKDTIPHYLEVEYESLRGHEFWVDDRKHFTALQTT